MYVHRDIYFITENFFECVKLIFKFIFYYVLYGNIFLLLLIYYN